MRQEVFFVMNTFLLYLNNLNVDTWHFTCTNILVKAKICDFAPSSAKVKMSSTSNSCTQDFGVTNENRKLKPKLFLDEPKLKFSFSSCFSIVLQMFLLPNFFYKYL